MWDEDWEKLFSSRSWGRYPDTEVIRFVGRNYFNLKQRDQCEILEVGCGTGANLVSLASEGFTLSGIDGSSSAIKELRNRLSESGLSASAQVGDVMNLPYPDNHFDCVLDCECLYSNSNADVLKILSEIKRVLKSGGKLFSMSFGIGTTIGDGSVVADDDPHTYLKLINSAVRGDCGLVRFMDRNDIERVYGQFFSIESIDYIVRARKNEEMIIKEWIIISKN